MKRRLHHSTGSMTLVQPHSATGCYELLWSPNFLSVFEECMKWSSFLEVLQWAGFYSKGTVFLLRQQLHLNVTEWQALNTAWPTFNTIPQSPFLVFCCCCFLSHTKCKAAMEIWFPLFSSTHLPIPACKEDKIPDHNQLQRIRITFFLYSTLPVAVSTSPLPSLSNVLHL